LVAAVIGARAQQPLPLVTAPPQEGSAGRHTVSNIIPDFCAILRIMLYAIVYLAFFLASGVLIPVTIRLLLGDTNRKWKPVAAGFLAFVLLLSLKL